MKFLEFINNSMRPYSMYKGLSLGLLGIWFVALILAFVGLLAFSPVAMIVSMLVLVLSTYGTSVLCGLLFGVKAHGESSLITGLILSLLFIPVIDVPSVVVLAFIGMIAGASKYIVTWRGRHIFNPAAFAAVVIGLTGLGAALWWVATPLLTPIVLAVVLVSLYQSKRFDVAGVFLAVSVPIFLIQCFVFGATIPEALWMLLSWPLLFLAGIMLTEPMTLPSRKWQMYIVAAVVAAVSFIPLHIGPLHMSPALALLIGNIVALILAKRRAIELTFKERRALTPTTDELIFTSDKRFPYTPGQYVELNLPHKKTDFRGSRRRFSVTSLSNTNEVSFGIKFYEPSSSFKKTLKHMKPGQSLLVTQLAGDFVLPNDSTRPLLFVAGGIGITPFASHLRWLETSPKPRNIVLVYAVSHPDEIAYKDLLEKSEARIIIVSPKRPQHMPKSWAYVEGSRVNVETLSELIPDIASRWAYVSGPTPFVQTTKHALKKQGVRGVKTDYFAGY